jgi:hypothetical protein
MVVHFVRTDQSETITARSAKMSKLGRKQQVGCMRSIRCPAVTQAIPPFKNDAGRHDVD